MKKLFILAFVTLFVSACSTTPLIQTEVVYKDKFVDIPESSLAKCPTSVPMDKATFIAATKDQRIEMLTDYVNNLIKDIGNCNEQLSNIKKLQATQKAIIENGNKK